MIRIAIDNAAYILLNDDADAKIMVSAFISTLLLFSILSAPTAYVSTLGPR